MNHGTECRWLSSLLELEIWRDGAGTPDVKDCLLLVSLLTLSALLSCSKSHDVAAEAKPPAKVITGADENLFSVDHPEQFPLAAAVAVALPPPNSSSLAW